MPPKEASILQKSAEIHMKRRHKTIPRKTLYNLLHSVAGKLLSSKLAMQS